MDIGMLWFDHDPKTDLTTKLFSASAYYLNKYGQTPNLCFVHPSLIPHFSAFPEGLEIRPDPVIRPHHFWLGRKS